MIARHSLAALILLTCAVPGRAQDAASRVEAALNAVWVHGVTAEIAEEEIGVAGLPFLLEALRDPDCERRDNVVAFLSHLAEAEHLPTLLALLDDPPGEAVRPEDRRALLLVPPALGWMARRDVPGASDALLAMTEDGPGSLGLDRAAAATRDPERFRRILGEQAIFGLGLATARRPEATERLRELAAADNPVGSLREAAEGALQLFGGPSPGLPRPLSSGTGTETFPGLPGDAPAPLPSAADGDSDVDEHAWTYANHPDTSNPLDDSRLDDITERSNLLVGRSDFAASAGNHGEDVACCVSFARSGSAQTFGSSGDGLDAIDNSGELTTVLNDGAARVKVVEAINWCGGGGSNIVGCAWQPGNGMALVRLSNLSQEARLWTHEYGHNIGLAHNTGTSRFIMYPSLNGTNDGVDGDGGADVFRDECAAFHSPSGSAGASITTEADACSDVDGDDVQDDLDNCPTVANFDQADSDGDGTGDACECSGTDSDGDGHDDCADNCPDIANADQADADGDLAGDACDACPNDADKTAAGDCGCGVADDDSDGDGTLDCNDGCPDDPAKTEPGDCGCGLSDGDSDGDGLRDCDDGCPNDASKTEPGVCGCGEADADSDGDGTFDCNDGCPDDANKTEPGDCGCGESETDSDGDGTADCNDGCPGDPDKTSPGVCGCGASDGNQDGDNHLDCEDNCPTVSNNNQRDRDGDGFGDACEGCDRDADKTEPGQCGCGSPDTDTDGDGTADCIDACPDDPDKTAAGACGCGESDADSDGDGTADCEDGCPVDAAKTAPGVCGCGESDADSDGDGTADCDDGCPDDAGKTSPGTCGCGVSDADSDGDGTADCDDLCEGWPDGDDEDGDGIPEGCDDCNDDGDDDGDGTLNCRDQCPDDADKIAPGTCGCGVSDADGDGDGTPDCNDGCPSDPSKTEPGLCGCGENDLDSDGDGTPDCDDGCPEDGDKIAAGACGCGVADADSDGDGTPDCNDGCPDDAAKTAPGACGCGVPDVDADGDGTPDCNDGCPEDGDKTAPGACGCGISDADGDGDGTLDCLDGCPADPLKVEAGACGCGVSDEDSDGDGVADCLDNCPEVPNADQADEDGNGLGDACTCDDKGDVHPDGVGNGRIDMRDFVIGHRKLKGSLPLNDNDRDCGDAFPGTVACSPQDGPESWCVAGDAAFDAGDLSVIRSQVSGVLVQSCESCGVAAAGESLRRAGDIAPRAATDDVIDVSDVLVILRWAVGLDLPLEAEESLRADVAPADMEAGFRVVRGDGVIDVSDVLLVLRAAVQLEELKWPLRRLTVSVDEAGDHVAIAVRTSGWPVWASADGLDVPGCDTETGGLEALAGLRGLACVLDPGPGSTPGEIAALLYRAPEVVAGESLAAEVELVDALLTLTRPVAVLGGD